MSLKTGPVCPWIFLESRTGFHFQGINKKIWANYKDYGEAKTIKVATRSARLSRHVTQECTANFQWRRKSSQNVNKDFLVVRFGNITKDFISWRRCAKMKIRYYESIRPKKSEKNISFRFPKQEGCTSTDIFKKILGSCKIICSTKCLISSLHNCFSFM